MTTPPKTIHVSVAWPYANGDLHVGHLAGAYLPADIFARYHRLRGNRVLMVSGSDSHGTPIMVEANKRGMTPRDLFERYHRRFLETQKAIGISYDLFTHTDTVNHHRISQDFFRTLLARGYLRLEKQTLLYSELEQRFLPDRFIEGECYICGYKDARGDQCDNCGNLMDPMKLINPRSKENPQDRLVPRETEHYFLELDKFQEAIARYLDSHEGHWRPAVLNFSRNFLKDVRPRPITRDIDWGIPIPLEGWGEQKRMYVWFEAVIGYFSASVEWAKNQGTPDAWRDWWYNPDCQMYCFIGKDNIPFHTVIWQAELLGVDGLYALEGAPPITLPYDVPANEFMNIEGQQFSKSRNWAVWLPDILRRYQPDAIRYYVARSFPETSDSDFSWENFFNSVNAELLAAWGNLVNRVIGFAYKRFDGRVPTYDALTDADQALIARIESGFDSVGGLLERVRLRDALLEAMGLAREVNVYLDQRAPWKTIKTDEQDAARSIYTALRAIDNLKTLLAPFLPFSSQQVRAMLGYAGQLFGEQIITCYDEDGRTHDALIYDGSAAIGRWEASQLPQGQALREPTPLYVKLEDEMIATERARLGQPREEVEDGF
ncbi:MAG: methionine--tRNA ligase [Anaerolineae bacterium]|nr:methionine--tRNA ligase [Anaerolineae bacterium]MDW8172260.1 methionine--tRNA ligase [Anaerolineae bacterium]